MLLLLLNWILMSLVLLLVAWMIPGITLAGFGTAVLATLVLSLVNLLVKPILMLLTLPITILTFGLFSFILNALMFFLTAAIVGGFEINNFGSALLGSLLLAIVSSVVLVVLPKGVTTV